MKKVSLYILVSIAGLLMSCTKEYEGVFEKSPDERSSAVLSEYKEVLLSSPYGWIVNYYPNPEMLGGFTYVFKFDGNGTVKMNWGLRNQDDDEALYSIKMIEAPILSFDTYSIFTKMKDPDMGVYGKGFGGDNEFVFLRMSANKDTIYLRERLRNKDPMVLVKASATTWSDIKKYPAMSSILQRTNEKIVPFYYNLTIEGWSSPVTMTYFDDQQLVNLFFKENGKDTIITMGCNFTADGFQFHHALERNGIKVRSFKYDEALNQHIVTDKGVTGRFSYSTNCASAIKGAAQRFFGPGTFGSDEGYVSPKFKAVYGGLNPEGNIKYCAYSSYGSSWANYFEIVFDNWSSAKMNVANYELTSENTVSLTFSSYYEWDGGFSQQIMETPLGTQFRNLLFSPKGWTVVPVSFVTYGAKCVMVSNEDPEIYIFF